MLPPLRPKVAAYFEAGPYWEFSLLQKEIIKALQQRGVDQSIVFPSELHISPGYMSRFMRGVAQTKGWPHESRA